MGRHGPEPGAVPGAFRPSCWMPLEPAAVALHALRARAGACASAFARAPCICCLLVAWLLVRLRPPIIRRVA